MDRHGKTIAMPPREADMEAQPFLSFTSGYVQRARHLMPKQGIRRPWRVYQNYLKDLFSMRFGRIADGVLRFSDKGEMP
jgi:cyclohexanone monooxygenase